MFENVLFTFFFNLFFLFYFSCLTFSLSFRARLLSCLYDYLCSREDLCLAIFAKHLLSLSLGLQIQVQQTLEHKSPGEGRPASEIFIFSASRIRHVLVASEILNKANVLRIFMCMEQVPSLQSVHAACSFIVTCCHRRR